MFKVPGGDVPSVDLWRLGGGVTLVAVVNSWFGDDDVEVPVFWTSEKKVSCVKVVTFTFALLVNRLIFQAHLNAEHCIHTNQWGMDLKSMSWL